jgi:hypothetical protein
MYIRTQTYTQISILFAIEVLVKIAAVGVPEYFSNPWRILEFFVAACCIADASDDGLPLETFKSVRSFGLLRVVGMIGEWDKVTCTFDLLKKKAQRHTCVCIYMYIRSWHPHKHTYKLMADVQY